MAHNPKEGAARRFNLVTPGSYVYTVYIWQSRSPQGILCVHDLMGHIKMHQLRPSQSGKLM